VGCGWCAGGRRFTGLREAGVFLRADPEHRDDERIAETHDDHRKHKQHRQLVPGERDALEVAAEVAVSARHNCDIAGVVVVQHLPRVLRHAVCFVCYG